MAAAKLQDDPKVQELIAKSVVKAEKEQLKTVISNVKNVIGLHAESAKDAGDKVAGKLVAQISKDVVAALKA